MGVRAALWGTGGTSVTLCWVTLVTLMYFRGKKVMME